MNCWNTLGDLAARIVLTAVGLRCSGTHEAHDEHADHDAKPCCGDEPVSGDQHGEPGRTPANTGSGQSHSGFPQ